MENVRIYMHTIHIVYYARVLTERRSTLCVIMLVFFFALQQHECKISAVKVHEARLMCVNAPTSAPVFMLILYMYVDIFWYYPVQFTIMTKVMGCWVCPKSSWPYHQAHPSPAYAYTIRRLYAYTTSNITCYTLRCIFLHMYRTFFCVCLCWNSDRWYFTYGTAQINAIFMYTSVRRAPHHERVDGKTHTTVSSVTRLLVPSKNVIVYYIAVALRCFFVFSKNICYVVCLLWRPKRVSRRDIDRHWCLSTRGDQTGRQAPSTHAQQRRTKQCALSQRW